MSSKCPVGNILSLSVALLAAGMLIAGCAEAFPTEAANPVLVTLPAVTAPPPTPSEEPPTPTATPTVQPTEPVLVAPTLPVQGAAGTRLLWDWSQVARPTALAATGSRVAVIASDGRFEWLNADTGVVEASAFLWSGILEGDSLGEVYTDGQVAVVSSREMSVKAETGRAESRARLVVYGPDARELWSLPLLTAQRFYSAALTNGGVIVGTWPHEPGPNTLTAYEQSTGKQLWQVKGEAAGFDRIADDGTRLYVLLDGTAGGGVACYDLLSGEALWQWADPSGDQGDRIAVDEGGVYVLSARRIVALDALHGALRWTADVNADPQAGLVAQSGVLALAPVPTVDQDYRPGIIAVQAETGQLAWHSLGGLLANPLASGGELIWTVIKDFDEGVVSLSGLDPSTGLERARVVEGDSPDALYSLVVHGRRIYVLGDSLRAFGY